MAHRVRSRRSNRPIWRAEAENPADPPVADHPVHRRVAAQPIRVILKIHRFTGRACHRYPVRFPKRVEF